MRELSLYILDIVQNSIAAKASYIEIMINEDLEEDLFEIAITDNGKGMTEEELEKSLDPFYTSRKSRKVGLGLSLYKAHAQECGGQFLITSQVNQGTRVYASFLYGHIDRMPLGNIVATIVAIISGNKELHLLYTHYYQGQKFVFDTQEVKNNLDDLAIDNPLVLSWLKDYLGEHLANLVSSC